MAKEFMFVNDATVKGLEVENSLLWYEAMMNGIDNELKMSEIYYLLMTGGF